jgi:hypothetical protein
LYGLPERWEQKKKGPDLVAPALLPVINLVDRKSPSAASIFHFSRMSIIWFVHHHAVVELYAASATGSGSALNKGNLKTNDQFFVYHRHRVLSRDAARHRS